VGTSVRIAKRALDIAAATIGLAVTLPFYPLIAAVMLIESRGPIFYRQRRAGQLLGPDPEVRNKFRFKEFSMIKFRSMRPNAEAKTGAVIAAVGDARITRVGKVLRKTRIDELPQLWNVLVGDMSLIGPRPERPELMADMAMAIPFFEERMRGVKPGITGLAQVSLGYTGRPLEDSQLQDFMGSLTNPYKLDGADGALADDMRMKLLHDLAYGAATEDMRHYLRMEISIILRTPLVMLRGIGR
jgi:lipopolysaccharide/colanic/teichoic acid biosynthesis glycosyltransferase